MIKKELLTSRHIDLTLHRLACQLIENHGDFNQTVLIGLQPRGLPVLQKLLAIIEEFSGHKVAHGNLDITFYRDDFRRRDAPLKPNQTQIDVLVEGKHVVFVDDVLYTGRSVRSALDALQSFGRPATVELLVLIDRRFTRQLPIQPDYVGQQIDSLASQRVLVEWRDQDECQSDRVYLIKPENE